MHINYSLYFFILEYNDDQTLIPKNTSLIVSRIPLTTQQKKAWYVLSLCKCFTNVLFLIKYLA